MKTTLGLLALLTLATPCLLSADDKPGIKPAAPTVPAIPGKADIAKAKGKYTPLYAQVESITATLLTVKGAGPDTKFVINAETKISKDKAHKEAATVADVKPGQWIGGSYTKGADGSNALHSLHLGVNQKGEQPKKGEKPAAPKP